MSQCHSVGVARTLVIPGRDDPVSPRQVHGVEPAHLFRDLQSFVIVGTTLVTAVLKVGFLKLSVNAA